MSIQITEEKNISLFFSIVDYPQLLMDITYQNYNAQRKIKENSHCSEYYIFTITLPFLHNTIAPSFLRLTFTLPFQHCHSSTVPSPCHPSTAPSPGYGVNFLPQCHSDHLNHSQAFVQEPSKSKGVIECQSSTFLSAIK